MPTERMEPHIGSELSGSTPLPGGCKVTTGDGGESVSNKGLGFTIGQEVRLRVHAWNPANDHSPGGLFGKRGDKLVVKSIGPATYDFPIAVHHPEVTDGSAFSVRADEIEAWVE